jgi:ribosomal protein L32
LQYDLALVPSSCNEQPADKQTDQAASVLESIFDSFLLAAVPKYRRSLERKMTRRMQMVGHYEHAMPRKDLVVDQHTGMWKEKGTICSKCFIKIKF